MGTTESALDKDGVLEIDTTISLETTWHSMEDLVSMGLVRSIGIRYENVMIYEHMQIPEVYLMTSYMVKPTKG